MKTRDWIVLLIAGLVLLLLWWLLGKRQVQPTGGTNTVAFPTGSAGATGTPTAMAPGVVKTVLI